MNAKTVVVALVLATVTIFFLSAIDLTGNVPEPKQESNVLPKSLDTLYPPISGSPVYLESMMNMSRPFSGMISDVMQQDFENARGNFERFKQMYIESSKLVPEWSDHYPMEPVTQLESALNGNEPALIMPAVEELGKICHGCHLTTMVQVQQKYHWSNFADVIVTDPLSGKDVSFAQLMLMMETNFSGIGNDLMQGQKENAVRNFDGFAARFQAMTESCMMCHDSEREYYVDASITDMMANLKKELLSSDTDHAKAGNLLMSIGKESCSKCHLVHIPAAYAQQLMYSH